MKRASSITIFLLAISVSIHAQHKFTLNLKDIDDDLFKVTVIPYQLTEKNDIFQFAAIAPGTYETMDIGRFVQSFSAFDSNGERLGSKQLSTNQWQLVDGIG